MKVKWLDRRISAPGPYLCLCLSEAEYRAAMKHCRLDMTDPWIRTPQADATVHHAHSDHGQVAIVCMRDTRDRKPVEIAGLLVHEAVHIWQEWCAYYGEDRPGREQEAYAIQGIAQELMAEFARRMEQPCKK
jgi:hypothetical protein